MELLGSFRVAVKLQLVKGLPGASTYKIRMQMKSIEESAMEELLPNSKGQDPLEYDLLDYDSLWSRSCDALESSMLPARSLLQLSPIQRQTYIELQHDAPPQVSEGHIYSDRASFVESQHNYSTISEKLQKLGWTYRSLEEALMDSIESYKEAVLLD
ncbi:hypothetical protein CRG98_045781 [Punica granatum]|uniref:Uncharacterized protein n=1 Tax=Punica granatum TaxID=22663 RepID=A0A2I0HQ47_PUNGR|nr:hypothetical protein CRG98_045781 [Punica granatum]